MKLDMHVHTKFSFDSILKPEDIPKILAKREIDGLAVTDHDSIKGWNKVKKICKDFVVIQGMEIMTDRGEILGLFLSEDLRCGKLRINGRDMRVFDHNDVFDEIRRQDAIAVIPHLADRARDCFSETEKNKDSITALETLNGRVMNPKINGEAERLAKRLGIGMTGGSDAHSTWELGKAFTCAEASDKEEFRKCLLKHKTVPMGGVSNPIYKISSKILVKLKR